MKTEEREVADLRTYEQIRKETEIPKDAKKMVRQLLYVDLFPYDTVKEILKASENVSDVSVLASAVTRGKSVKFMKGYLVHGEPHLSLSYLDALDNRVPKTIVDKMRECGFTAAEVLRISEAYRSGIKRNELMLCIQKGMDADQIGVIIRHLKQKGGYEKARVIARPELDSYQMSTMERLFMRGLTPREAETFIDPTLNCRELLRRGMKILEQKRAGDGTESGDY